MMARILLSHIAFDAGTQIRASINESVVAQYAERMTEGDSFPPIVLFHDGNQHYLADGFHRFMAAQRNDFRDIDADVRPGTRQDALWFALGANRINGQRLDPVDVRHAVLMALAEWPDKSTSLIAEQVGCTHPYVSRLRQEAAASSSNKVPERVVGKDGKSYPSSRPRSTSEISRREVIAEMVSQGAKNEAIVAAVGGCSNSTIAKVRRDMGVAQPVDKSRAAVAQRRQDTRDMAERGFTTRQIASSLGIDEQTVAKVAKAEGIVIHADRVVGKTKRHDSTRIVENIVMDAENLTADVNLIEFDSLDRESFPRWIDSLIASQKSLGAFIKRLKQEQKNAEAAA